MATEIIIGIISGVIGVLVSVCGILIKLGGKLQILQDLKNRFEKFENKMDGLLERVSRVEGKLESSPTSSSSPVKLTSIGEEILVNSGIKEATDKSKNELSKLVKEKNPKTAYDIQEYCRDVFENFNWSDDDLNKFKKFSFQSGKWKLFDIYEVGAIYFRDILLRDPDFSNLIQ